MAQYSWQETDNQFFGHAFAEGEAAAACSQDNPAGTIVQYGNLTAERQTHTDQPRMQAAAGLDPLESQALPRPGLAEVKRVARQHTERPLRP